MAITDTLGTVTLNAPWVEIISPSEETVFTPQVGTYLTESHQRGQQLSNGDRCAVAGRRGYRHITDATGGRERCAVAVYAERTAIERQCWRDGGRYLADGVLGGELFDPTTGVYGPSGTVDEIAHDPKYTLNYRRKPTDANLLVLQERLAEVR